MKGNPKAVDEIHHCTFIITCVTYKVFRTLILKNRAEAGVFRVFWESERDAGSETKKKSRSWTFGHLNSF